jgi:SSS family solute:Na+ symporter
MAFTGVFLGLCSRAMFSNIDPETGIPLLITNVLPIGIAGLVTAAYFSSIMSTADSCLMASSANFVNDLAGKIGSKITPFKNTIGLAQVSTLIIGVIALVIALIFKTVLDAILYAYSFMVSGLLIPTMFAYFSKKHHSTAAFWSILAGGSTPVIMSIFKLSLPLGLDPAFLGISISALTYVTIRKVSNSPEDMVQ